MRMHVLFGLLLVCVNALAQPDPFPKIASSYMVKVNGELLWERQTKQKLPPASLTKLMTALLVLESYQPGAVIAISSQAAQETGMKLGLKAGQKWRVEDLLASALISSDNDSCHALAEFVAGDESRFVQLMNQRAAKLGMRNTHFTNACGHDAAGHFSTVEDLTLLAEASLKQPVIMDMVARESMDIHSADGSVHATLKSRNLLLGRYAGAKGLKTGYTPKAGKCLIAYAERKDTRVLLVMLHGSDRWWDAVDLLDLAFAQSQHDS